MAARSSTQPVWVVPDPAGGVGRASVRRSRLSAARPSGPRAQTACILASVRSQRRYRLACICSAPPGVVPPHTHRSNEAPPIGSHCQPLVKTDLANPQTHHRRKIGTDWPDIATYRPLSGRWTGVGITHPGPSPATEAPLAQAAHSLTGLALGRSSVMSTVAVAVGPS